jgi:hypothetical protein
VEPVGVRVGRRCALQDITRANERAGATFNRKFAKVGHVESG